MFDEILILKEVVDYLKLVEKIVYCFVLDVKLFGFKVGGSWCFKIEDIDWWIEEKKNNEVNK